MKLVSYLNGHDEQLAILVNGFLYKMQDLHPDIPTTMAVFLQYWEEAMPIAQAGIRMILQRGIKKHNAIPYDSVRLLAPVPHPTSCRDGYAFRQHVAAARRNRKAEMIPEFDQYPIFYFTNHNSIKGPGKVNCMPDHFEKLDFELEVAVVLCKHGINIKAEDADQYIGGLMIMNDLSARKLQMEEMLLNLGPAKGKDFATTTGPWLVTLDELQQHEVPAKEGHVGKNWDLTMSCRVNSLRVSEGNMRDMDWTFAEIIERASYGAELHAGDVIGSGTVGTGCFLELNGTGRLNDPAYREQWLQPGDMIDMEIEGLGILSNTITAENTDWSILKRKKPFVADALKTSEKIICVK